MSERGERLVFVMPSEAEIFVAAVAVLQFYLDKTRKVRAAPDVYILNQIAEYERLLQEDIIGPRKLLKRFSDGLLDGPFDLAFRFDELSAYALAKPTGRHITEAFGIQLGVEPSSLPNLSALDCSPKYDVCILPWSQSVELADLIGRRQPEWHILSSWSLGETPTFATSLRNARECSMVIGPRSVDTYLAAALGRIVVELYPTDRHRDWLSKWACQTYQMIYATPGTYSLDMIWRAAEVLWEHRPRRLSTPMAQ